MDKKTQQQLLKLVKKNYQEIAAEYDRTRRKTTTPLWQKMDEYARKVSSGNRILDVGCGNGKLLEFLPANIDYLGIDSSKKMIEISASRFPGKKFKTADILELQKLNETDFDEIFCIAVIHHLPGQDLRIRALQNMAEKLNPGGKIIITAWNLWSQKKFRKLLFKNLALKLLGGNKMEIGDIVFDWKGSNKQTASKRYYHAFTKKEFKKIIKKAGLTPKSIYKDKYNYFAEITK
jgi:ubiquinone/menaquinone biosynthesis C-methylase UbiE